MHAVRLAKHLNEDEFQVRLLAFRPNGGYEAMLGDGVEFVSLLPSVISSSFASCVLAVWPLRRFWRKSPPDVVMSFLPPSHSVVSFALGGLTPRPRLILGVQNNVDQELQNRPWRRRAFFPGEPDRAYRSSDAIVALSDGVGKNFCDAYPDISDRVSVIPNIGCEFETATLAKERVDKVRPDGAYLLVACGRLDHQKDYPTLLAALAKVKADRPVHLWILGRGRLEAELRRLVNELGIRDRVEFLGFRTNPYQFMAIADLFVLSSAWEGFGNVIVEAMASGVPVISTDCPFGPSEILNEGRYGPLVPVGDSAFLAKAISELLPDVEKRRDLAKMGRDRAKKYLPDCIVPHYEVVLRSVL